MVWSDWFCSRRNRCATVRDEQPFSFNAKAASAWELKTSALIAKISVNPVSIAFYTPEGVLINQDELKGKPMGYADEGPVCTKQLQSGEHFLLWRAHGFH